MSLATVPPKSRALQISLFATGCSGIVAEFVLSTLATYLIGNATFQWTLVMSVMLFAMGVGSRCSRYFKTDLFDTFILAEFLLSSLIALSSLICFGLSIYIEAKELVIYPLAFLIGSLIGLEIPLVIRLNSSYQRLRTNISIVLEMDYFGSLVGGVLFAFLFLPFLGFAHTPVLLGIINFSVASWLMWHYMDLTVSRRLLKSCFFLCLLILGLTALFSRQMIDLSEQKKYKDTIIYSKQTQYQTIVMTRWRSDIWLYINGQEQFSSYDEERYHEPLVHPAMGLASSRSRILILGGGDGLALREVLKYEDVGSVVLVDLDPVMTELAKNHPLLKRINNAAMSHEKVRVVNQDAAAFLSASSDLFNVVILDLPDPDSMDIMHLYSDNFYALVKKHLTPGGIMVTQATSPFFAKQAFLCIYKTVKSSGFTPLAFHTQVPTLGEWGFVLAVKSGALTKDRLKAIALKLTFSSIPTRFISQDAMISMAHFGKGVLEDELLSEININTESDPVLYNYYNRGAWGVY